MKLQKRMKQRIAAALIVAMTVGMTAGSAWAEENPTNKWVLDGGNWYYYNGKGEIVKDREKYIHGKWYGFDADGVMYSDELFKSHDQSSEDIIEEPSGGDTSSNRLYANKAGDLARGWVKLNQDGHLYETGDGEAYWYYFKGGSEEKCPGMVRGGEKEIQGNVYRFDITGKMYQKEWHNMIQATQGGEDEYGVYYYQSDGPKAINKWLPINGYWYSFNNKGEVQGVAPMASSSNAGEDPVVAPGTYHKFNEAPARQVASVTLASGSNANISVPLGESVKLKFKVTLASDSNANIQDFKGFKEFHDFEPGSHVSGRFYVNKVKTDKDGICTVEYKPKKLGKEDVTLSIDGIISEPAITVTAELPKDTTQKKEAVDTLVDAVFEDGMDTREARDTIAEILGESDDTDKKEIHEKIVKNSNYAALDSNYAMENAIEVKPVNVTEAAQKLLSGGKITLVGGALNAEDNSIVELKVAPSAETPTLTQEFKKKVSLDIRLEIDEDNQTELLFPIKVILPIPVGFNAKYMKLFHIHNGVEKELEFMVSDESITFIVSNLSDFVFVQNESGEGGHGGSGGGGGSSSSSAGGVVTTDGKKGKVNSLTGIIIGSGDGYSKWVQETVQGQETTGRWKLQYADGTYAAGSYVLDEQGNPKRDSAGNLIEQPLWEMIGGVWYAFGADGYAKSGMVFDPAQNGWFYIDINTGMKTGWQQIDGKWHYFNPTSDGSKGIMFVNTTTPDGYKVGADGAWDGQ